MFECNIFIFRWFMFYGDLFLFCYSLVGDLLHPPLSPPEKTRRNHPLRFANGGISSARSEPFLVLEFLQWFSSIYNHENQTTSIAERYSPLLDRKPSLIQSGISFLISRLIFCPEGGKSRFTLYRSVTGGCKKSQCQNQATGNISQG